MAEAEVLYIFTWNALSDACPKCQSLNGREWHERDIFKNILWDPIWGDIWDLSPPDPSLAHPNCRCQLTMRVETVNIEIPEAEEFTTEMEKLDSLLNSVVEALA